MGMSVGGNKSGMLAEINVTPLVDVMLVLIIIFMVVTPILTAGVDVTLPEGKTGDSSQDVGQHLTVSIQQDQSVFVETSKSSLDKIVEDINAFYAANEARPLLIKADRRLTWKEVRAVMDPIAEGGLTTMLLAVEKDKE
jgi:biopolymer transport protein TolR